MALSGAACSRRRTTGCVSADEMIEMFRLKHVADLPAGSLSHGQQKLVNIAMAFMPSTATGVARRTLRRCQSVAG